MTAEPLVEALHETDPIGCTHVGNRARCREVAERILAHPALAARMRAAEPDTVTVDWQAFDRDVLGEPDTVTALADEARLVAQWADAVDPMPDELRAELHDLGVHARSLLAAPEAVEGGDE